MFSGEKNGESKTNEPCSKCLTSLPVPKFCLCAHRLCLRTYLVLRGSYAGLRAPQLFLCRTLTRGPLLTMNTGLWTWLKLHCFRKKSCLSAVPKRIRSLFTPLFKNSFSTHFNFQGAGPWEGPVHFSRFALRVHNCSNIFQSWSWSQKKREKPVTKAIAKFKAQAFPKRIRSLFKLLLKNSFSAHFQGTGPWEGPVHFSRFALRVHNCSNIFQSLSWSQKKREKPVTKAIAKFKAQAFPKRIRSLVKPLIKNSFSTNFQGTGPWEGPVHFSRFFLGVHNCSKIFQSWSWSQEKKEKPLQKQHFLSLSFSSSSSSSLSVRLPLPLLLPLPLPRLVPPPPLLLPLPLSLSLSPSLVPFLFFFLFLLLCNPYVAPRRNQKWPTHIIVHSTYIIYYITYKSEGVRCQFLIP